MGLFSKKKDLLFNAARKKVSSLSSFIEQGENKVNLDKNKWVSIIDHDPNSPMIMGMGENKHLIYYPPFSTPYLHQYEKSIKYAKILSGTIFDKVSGKKYRKDDDLKIMPQTKIQPFTLADDAYVWVCVTEIDDIWERICE